MNSKWEKLVEKLKKEKEKVKSGKDERFWELKPVSKEKWGLKIIRFIPDKNNEPFVRVYKHIFSYVDKNGQKKWYYGFCPTTLEKECPICKKNSIYWNSGFEDDKEIARKRKRQEKFISNIFVIKDEANPENEGKVFLFEYGRVIFNKIERHILPSEEDLNDDEFIQFIPFDLEEGANFKLKIKGGISKTDDYRNYDDSEFSKQSPFLNGDKKKISEVIEKTYPLSEFLDEKNYPTYEEIIKRLGYILQLEDEKNILNEEKNIDTDFKEEDDDFEEDTFEESKEDNNDLSLDDDIKFFEDLK